jgi:hypothetical protein
MKNVLLFDLLGVLLAGAVAAGGCTPSGLDLMTLHNDGGASPERDGGGRDAGHLPADLRVHDLRQPHDAAAQCLPDLQKTVGCARCGTMTLTCMDGKIVPGACENQRDCSPGDSQETPDGCAIQFCTADCHWGPYGLKPGKACVTGGVQTCNAGLGCPHSGIQVCMSCQWGPCNCN